MSVAANLLVSPLLGGMVPEAGPPKACTPPIFVHSALERNPADRNPADLKPGERERPCKEKCPERVVLWIDHDGLFLAVAEERLRSYGYCALVAQSAVMGLFLSTLAKVQAVIVGDGLPMWEGARLAQQIKEMRPELPVFFCGQQPGGGQSHEGFSPQYSLEAILPKAGLGMEKLAQRLDAAIQRMSRAASLAGNGMTSEGNSLASDQADSSAPPAA